MFLLLLFHSFLNIDVQIVVIIKQTRNLNLNILGLITILCRKKKNPALNLF